MLDDFKVNEAMQLLGNAAEGYGDETNSALDTVRIALEDLKQSSSAEILRLQAEVVEVHNEVAALCRAYLHEKWRAEQAIKILRQHGYGGDADALTRRAYKGAAERICAR